MVACGSRGRSEKEAVTLPRVLCADVGNVAVLGVKVVDELGDGCVCVCVCVCVRESIRREEETKNNTRRKTAAALASRTLMGSSLPVMGPLISS